MMLSFSAHLLLEYYVMRPPTSSDIIAHLFFLTVNMQRHESDQDFLRTTCSSLETAALRFFFNSNE